MNTLALLKVLEEEPDLPRVVVGVHADETRCGNLSVLQNLAIDGGFIGNAPMMPVTELWQILDLIFAEDLSFRAVAEFALKDFSREGARVNAWLSANDFE